MSLASHRKNESKVNLMLLSTAFAKLVASALIFTNIPAVFAVSMMTPALLSLLALAPALFFGATSLYQSAETMPRRHR